MTSFLDGSAESEMRLMDLTKTLEVSILITSAETGDENSGEYRTTVAPALSADNREEIWIDELRSLLVLLGRRPDVEARNFDGQPRGRVSLQTLRRTSRQHWRILLSRQIRCSCRTADVRQSCKFVHFLVSVYSRALINMMCLCDNGDVCCVCDDTNFDALC